MVSDWSLSIAAWVIQDGNYPDFTRGDRLELAVEFYAPEPLVSSGNGARDAVGDGDGWYVVDGTVAAILESVWVIDCGIMAYGARSPAGVAVGDGVAGRVLLSVDHFGYFESLAKLPAMPELIYTWDLTRIRRETAPNVPDATGNVRVRDETKRKLVEIEATDAWNDNDGRAKYVLDCRLADLPPKRTSSTAL